jgi:hypothetical protein
MMFCLVDILMKTDLLEGNSLPATYNLLPVVEDPLAQRQKMAQEAAVDLKSVQSAGLLMTPMEVPLADLSWGHLV